MTSLTLELPKFGFIVATRAMIGVGIGLLLAERIPEDRRRTIGLTLLGIGVATTIPAVMVLRRAINEHSALAA